MAHPIFRGAEARITHLPLPLRHRGGLTVRMLPSGPLGVLIRFQNSASTLPPVLAALRAQTLQPDFILGVDSGSTDDSPSLLSAAGARLLRWREPYHHSRVLNFGLAHCPAERVLILSSHTVLASPDALAQLHAALDDPRTCCASGKWDGDPYYSDAIAWPELLQKGLKLGSIYSNSFGLIRRSAWEALPFDESVPTMEDYAWAVAQVRRGHLCRRVDFEFSYQRQNQPRDFLFTCCAFRLAAEHGLPVRWLGRMETARQILRSKPAAQRRHWARLLASCVWPLATARLER